jgi:hypothetical protein
MTIGLARTAAMDAANRQMRRDGRERWNEDDWNLAGAELERICREFGLRDPWRGAGFSQP